MQVHEFVHQLEAMEVDGLPVHVFHMPMKDLKTHQPWVQPLLDAGLTLDTLAIATISKVICSRATIFLGSVRSTFTTDIQRLRYGFRRAVCCDSLLNFGEISQYAETR